MPQAAAVPPLLGPHSESGCSECHGHYCHSVSANDASFDAGRTAEQVCCIASRLRSAKMIGFLMKPFTLDVVKIVCAWLHSDLAQRLFGCFPTSHDIPFTTIRRAATMPGDRLGPGPSPCRFSGDMGFLFQRWLLVRAEMEETRERLDNAFANAVYTNTVLDLSSIRASPTGVVILPGGLPPSAVLTTPRSTRRPRLLILTG